MSRAFLVLPLLAAFACSSQAQDPPSPPGSPTPLGPGSRIHDLTPPLNGDTVDSIGPNPSHPPQNANVNITGVAVGAVDNFDETHDGKSLGYIYVQDVGSENKPFSGLELYRPTFVPADLRVSPGDIIDLAGPYQDWAGPSTATFPLNEVVPELAKPQGAFRYEYTAPGPTMLADPTVLSVKDYDHWVAGSQWLGMLVTVTNVSLTNPLTNDGSGRVSGAFTADKVNGPVITNELYNLQPTDFAVNTNFASVTGIVTYFFNFHIAPRSAADLVVAQ